MITNRFYVGLFLAPLLLTMLLGLVVSGGDPAFVGFLSGIGTATVAVIVLGSVPFVRLVNRWHAAPLAAVARLVDGRLVETIGGDRHVRVEGRAGAALVVFYTRTAETPGGDQDTPGTPWTCVGSLRPGRHAPSVEVRLLPDGTRHVRWTNRWWDVFPRRAAPDPVVTDAAHAAEAALRALSPDAECRLRYGGDVVAFAAPGTLLEPPALQTLFDATRVHVAAL